MQTLTHFEAPRVSCHFRDNKESTPKAAETLGEMAVLLPKYGAFSKLFLLMLSFYELHEIANYLPVGMPVVQ